MDKASELAVEMKAEMEASDKDLLERFKATDYNGFSPSKEVEVILSGSTGRVANVRITTKDTGRALELLIMLATNQAFDNYNAAWKKNNEEYTATRKAILEKYTKKLMGNVSAPPLPNNPLLPKKQPTIDPVNWGASIFGGRDKKVDKKD
jgi:DNA-binding protein YbaB